MTRGRETSTERRVELETNLRAAWSFTITEKAPTRTLLSRRYCETSNFAKIRFYLYKEGKHPLRGERVVRPRLQQLLAEDCLLYNLAPRVSGLVWCRDRYETENKAINGWYKQQSQIKCKVYQSVPENQKYIDCVEKRKTRLVIWSMIKRVASFE